MRIATYYAGTQGAAPESAPDEILDVDDDIAREFITGSRAMLRRDNRRHGLTDRIAEIDASGAFVRWLS